jgi:hypothetical protein
MYNKDILYTTQQYTNFLLKLYDNHAVIVFTYLTYISVDKYFYFGMTLNVCMYNFLYIPMYL